MTAGQAVNELAAEYSGQPILFLEHDYMNTVGDRWSRFWTAFDRDVASYPLVIVDSGHQVADGSVGFGGGFLQPYRDMVEAELARPPQADVEAYVQRVGDTLVVNAWITNQSPWTLGVTATGSVASVAAFVYEESRVMHTDRFVRAAPYVWLFDDLPPGQTASFRLETEPLSGVAWERLHTVVLVDARPPGEEAYDMLQAAFAQPGALSVAPESLTFFTGGEGTVTPGPIGLRLRGVYDSWSVTDSPGWLHVDPASGTFADVPVISLGSGPIPDGWQHGELVLAVAGPGGNNRTVRIPVAAFQGPFYQSYLPVLK